MKVHRIAPVTCWQGGYPAFGSFETACGRPILGKVKFTYRKTRVTCGTCRKAKSKSRIKIISN